MPENCEVLFFFSFSCFSFTFQNLVFRTQARRHSTIVVFILRLRSLYGGDKTYAMLMTPYTNKHSCQSVVCVLLNLCFTFSRLYHCRTNEFYQLNFLSGSLLTYTQYAHAHTPKYLLFTFNFKDFAAIMIRFFCLNGINKRSLKLSSSKSLSLFSKILFQTLFNHQLNLV